MAGMAGSQLLPLALALLLLVRPGDSLFSGVAKTEFRESIAVLAINQEYSNSDTILSPTSLSTVTTPSPTSPSSDITSSPTSLSTVTTPSPTSPSSDTTPSPTSSTVTPTPTSPSSEATPTLDSSSTGTNPGSASPEPETASLPSPGPPDPELTTMSQSTNVVPQESPTVSSPDQDAGSLWIPTSHRNPGVVIAVCLLLSAVLIGSLLTAVRRCGRGGPAFHNLDTVSMASVTQQLPFADHLQS
ncbi:proline-rich receptor-like protein kinase PERK1 [Mesocricetus auratus]|uniref:Proline-rich receptor-like protein kinase PERK1 n=1 Tax=Mesocricetus auratus TaxID=10036 RepID=A0ABM2XAU4_MESAU|nr:proline-rich receptor-like protein kinase PERK1 [Mesocricetus auratus]